MIFKRLPILAIFLLHLLLSYGQNQTDSIRSSTLRYDVDSLLVLRIDLTQDTIYVKYFIPPLWQDACITRFKGGYKAFTVYCDSMYFNREDYNYDELNASALYTILFDENFKIKDVRILTRLAYDNSKYDYDALVKRILWSSEGKWEKLNKNDHCKWYFGMGYFKLR